MAALRGAGNKSQGAKKSQIMPVLDSESKAPWDGSRLVVKLIDFDEFLRRERVTIGAPDEWEGRMPVYTVRPMATGLVSE